MLENSFNEIYKRTQKLEHENDILASLLNFQAALLSDLEDVIGDLSKENQALKQSLDIFERDSFENIKLMSLIQKDAIKAEEEKSILLESGDEILYQLGEIAEEKRKAELERQLLEQTGLDLARNIGEIFQEKQLVEKLNKELENKTKEANDAKTQIKGLLNKIFPIEIAEEMILGKVNFKTLNVTVVFSDLKQFSTYAKDKKPEKIASDLKLYFNDIDRILKSHNGWLVKYIGDSVMMLFGVPYLSKSHAMDAVLTAFRIKEATKNYPWDTRFGINTGLLTVGDIGSIYRPQYDAIGDAVNVAARLERFGKQTGKDIIVTVDTFVRIHRFFHAECLGDIELKGVGSYRLYEVTGLKGVFDNDLRVPKSSLLLEKYFPLEKEIKEKMQLLFPNFDFLQLESKGGSLNHSLAVAIFAIAIKREMQLNISEDDLIIIACLHDIGKLYIKSSALSMSDSAFSESEIVENIHELSIRYLKKNNLYVDKIDSLKEIFQAGLNKSTQALILQIANDFDNMIYPKFYMTEGKSISEAYETLKIKYPVKITDVIYSLLKER